MTRYIWMLTGLLLLFLLAGCGADLGARSVSEGVGIDPNGGKGTSVGPRMDDNGRNVSEGLHIDPNGRSVSTGPCIDPWGVTKTASLKAQWMD